MFTCFKIEEKEVHFWEINDSSERVIEPIKPFISAETNELCVVLCSKYVVD